MPTMLDPPGTEGFAMSVAASSPKDDDDNRSLMSRVHMWVSHRLMPIWIVMLVCLVASPFLPWQLSLSVVSVFTVFYALRWFSLKWHWKHRLCVRCLDNVVLDMAEQADRRVRTLLWCHRLSSRPASTIFNVALMVVCVVSIDMVIMSRINILPVVFAPTFLVDYLYRVHSRLQPRCKFCRWGRGDDGPPEVMPTPPVPTAENLAST